MPNAYRDDLEAAREKIRGLTAELEEAREELARSRGKNDEVEALLGKLRDAMGEGVARPARSAGARSKRRVMMIAALGAITSLGGSALAARHFARQTPSVAPPLMSPPLLAESPPARPHALMPGTEHAAPSPAPPPPEVVACAGEAGYIEVKKGTTVSRYATECSYRHVAFPFAEILEKPDGTPYFIAEACDGPDKSFEVVGPVQKLPGSMESPRVTQRTGRSDREASNSAARITKFGAVGEMVEGDVTGIMRPGLNEDPQPISAHFRVCRKSDRQSP